MSNSETSEEKRSTAATAENDENQDCNENGRISRRFKDLKSKLLYNAILVGILVVFGIFGAFVFKACEAASVESGKNDVNVLPSTRDKLHEILGVNTANCDENDENWKNLVVEKLELFIKAKTEEAQLQETVHWRLADSWLFACTIFTTVGYGNIAPVSLKGRVFCMIFAAIGIPLFSVVAGSLVSFITDVMHACHAEYHIRKRQAKLAQQKKDDDQSPQLNLGEIPELELSWKHFSCICLGYLCMGALFFSVGEGWSLFESFYYCFITLTTVGLGDYVPGYVHHTSLFGVYILVGIVLLIMFFGAIEDIINQGFQKMKDKLKVTP